MKRFTAIFLAVCLLLLVPIAAHAESAPADNAPADENIVYLAIKGYGLIVVELNPDEAPITVANFKKLVSEGFYDGLTFHRVIESFMIQGGDPNGNGTGGSDEKIKGEFSMNRVDNDIKHVRGTISMARSGHPYEGYYNAGYYDISYAEREPYYNSASSQFFIVTQTSANNTASLDGKYAAFGQVIEGMEVVDKIAAVATDDNDKPKSKVKIAVATFDRAEAEKALSGFPWWGILLIVLGGLAVVIAVFAIVSAHNKNKKARLAAEAVARTSKKKNRKH